MRSSPKEKKTHTQWLQLTWGGQGVQSCLTNVIFSTTNQHLVQNICRYKMTTEVLHLRVFRFDSWYRFSLLHSTLRLVSVGLTTPYFAIHRRLPVLLYNMSTIFPTATMLRSSFVPHSFSTIA